MWYLAGLQIVDRNYAMVVNAFLWTALALVTMIARLYTRAGEVLIRLECGKHIDQSSVDQEDWVR